jgi:hypothetical protein
MDDATLRYITAFSGSTRPEDAPARVEALSVIVRSLVQEVAALRRMLEARRVWDEAAYRSARLEVMTGDHGGAGAIPWRNHSAFRHARDEEGFLREVLGASDAEVEAFRRECRASESLT